MAAARILSASVAYAAPALLLGWYLGGQALTGRIDAWLAVPLLMPGALRHARLTRGADRARRALAAVAALVLLFAAQGALHIILAARPGVPALLVTAVAGAVCLTAAQALDTIAVRWRRAVRWTAFVFAALLWFGASHGTIALLHRGGEPAVRPVVVMLSGLPLRWGGTTDLAAMLDRGPADHPALARLDRAVDLRLVDSLEALPPDARLFLAHPRALAPADLVRIDEHVRKGGEAVILADALSSWPPPHPLGDPRNPPITSLLTPLLDHWGIELAAPAPTDQGDVPIRLSREGPLLRLHSAGRFVRLPSTCRAFGRATVAECRIGAGRALIVGDADLLHESQWQSPLPWVPWLRRADTMAWLPAQLRGDAWGGWRAPLWIRPRGD